MRQKRKTMTSEMEPGKALQRLCPLLKDNVNVNRDNFAEMMQGALGDDDGEMFRCQMKGPRERMAFVMFRAHRTEVWKTLRLGLLLNGYTEEWRAVNQMLPPCDSPKEDPRTWKLPLTSIREYLLQTVDPRRRGMSQKMADALYKDPSARQAFKECKLERRKLVVILLDSLDRPEVLDAFRRALRTSGQREEADAVERALIVERAFLGRTNRVPPAP